MADQGFPGFDRTMQETHVWLGEISDEMKDSRRQVAYHALRGVLFALRDRLAVEEVFDLAAQLPMLIRGIYFEGYRPGGKPEKYDRAGFLSRVSHELQKADGANPETATRAVLAVLQRHVSPGEVSDVRNALPKEIQDLWPNTVGV